MTTLRKLPQSSPKTAKATRANHGPGEYCSSSAIVMSRVVTLSVDGVARLKRFLPLRDNRDFSGYPAERMLIEINPNHPEPRKIRQAVDALEAGEVIGYPTDTVYGLGCDFASKKATERLYAIKGMDRGAQGSPSFAPTWATSPATPSSRSLSTASSVTSCPARIASSSKRRARSQSSSSRSARPSASGSRTTR